VFNDRAFIIAQRAVMSRHINRPVSANLLRPDRIRLSFIREAQLGSSWSTSRKLWNIEPSNPIWPAMLDDEASVTIRSHVHGHSSPEI
jgi:hypothetical protein